MEASILELTLTTLRGRLNAGRRRWGGAPHPPGYSLAPITSYNPNYDLPPCFIPPAQNRFRGIKDADAERGGHCDAAHALLPGALPASVRSAATTHSREKSRVAAMLTRRHLQVPTSGWRRGDEQMNPPRANFTRKVVLGRNCTCELVYYSLARR